MTDDVSKLPAWPEAPFTNTLDSDYELAWSMFYRRNADAYRARMEALVDIVSMMSPSCADMHHDHRDRHTFEEPCPVLARLDALLAACERRSEQ